MNIDPNPMPTYLEYLLDFDLDQAGLDTQISRTGLNPDLNF